MILFRLNMKSYLLLDIKPAAPKRLLFRWLYHDARMPISENQRVFGACTHTPGLLVLVLITPNLSSARLRPVNKC